MVIVVGNGHGDPISNTGFASICEDVCISHNAYSVGNGMNLAILPQVMSKLYGRLCYLTFVWQSVKRENSGLKPVKLRIRIDLVSHPAHEEKLLNSHTHTPTPTEFLEYEYDLFTKIYILRVLLNCTRW